RQSAQQILARRAAMLRHRQHRRDVVAGVRIISGEKRVMEIELADGDAVGPGCPLRLISLIARQAEDRRARRLRMGLRLRPRGRDRMPRDRGSGDRGVVDDAVADHLGHLVLDTDRIRGNGRDLPGELIGAVEPFGGFVAADPVVFHGTASSGMSRRSCGSTTGAGRPLASTATISNVPRTAERRNPLKLSSWMRSTATVIDDRPTRATLATHSINSPTRTGSSKIMLSAEAITTCWRAWRVAAMN